MQHIAANCPWCKSRWRLARGWFARLAADPEPRTEEPRWDSKRGGDIGNRHGGMLPPELLARNSLPGTPCPEPLALLPWERLGEPRNPRTQESQNPGKTLCDIPAGTADNRGPWGLPEALNGGLEASIKRTPGLVEKGQFQGFWGVGPWRGCFSATEYGHLIPWGYLERDFRLFKARVCPSDSDSPDRVVPRNFTAGSGSNGCNNFPTGDRLPLHPPWLLL